MRGTEEKTTLELKLEKLRQICERAPDHHVGLLALAETAFRRGLRLEALEAYQRVLKEESVAEAHLCMAQMYRHHGLFQEAISELRSLFEVEPSYPEAHIFARELSNETQLPQDIAEVLRVGCGHDELALARVRLSIARSLVLREGQELVAIKDANSNNPTYGYYIGETRKRLSYCEQVLSQLGDLEEAHRAYLLEQERQRLIDQERQRELSEIQQPAQEESPQLGGEVTATTAETFEFSQEDPDEQADTGDEIDDSESAESLEEIEAAPGDEEPQFPEPDQELEFSPTLLEDENLDEILPEPEPEPNPSEPTLWEDPPLTTYASSNPSEVPRNDYGDSQIDEISIDLTPTLVGDLPDAQPEESFPEPNWAQEVHLEPEPEEILSQDEPDSTLGDDLHFPVQSPVIAIDFEATPSETEPVVSEPEPEELPEPTQETDSDSGYAQVAPTPDYAELYAPLRQSVESLIQTLAKTRSVSSVFLVNRDGYCVAEIVKDSISTPRITEFIVETVHFLEAFAPDPQYWVLECAGGIVVMQSVDSFHFLVTIGQSGANFGALRYTMDRVRPNFEQVLQPACPTP